MQRRPFVVTFVVAMALALVCSLVPGLAPHPVVAQDSTPVDTASAAAIGDFAGLVDIGDRSLYLECHGAGSPTVVLVSGYRASGHYWTDDLLHPDVPREMVLPGVAEATRVCTYDRPGTYAPLGDEDVISRSDAIAQPRHAPDAVEELHTLLQAAEVPGPYVLVGHSLGGFFARLYASTYPDEVVGLVLVDAYTELLEDQMSPEEWRSVVTMNQGMGTDTDISIPDYGDVETFGFGADNAFVRGAIAASPLRPMPLFVLAHGKSFTLPADTPGVTGDEFEAFVRASNQAKIALVPQARYTIADQSGHDIHQDQPEIVIEAVRQVVAGVRNPDTWYDLISCCAP